MSSTSQLELIETISKFTTTISNLSKLDIEQRSGSTGYIDFINPEEVTETATSGIDCFSRNFVVLKGKIFYNNATEIEFFQTFFRRYTDNFSLYMGAGWKTPLMDTVGGMSKTQINFITNLIEQKDIDIEQYRSEHATGDIENYINDLRFTLPSSNLNSEIKITRVCLC
jgi:hypothetical protein